MTIDEDFLFHMTQGFLILATIFAMAFPVLFAFSPWYRTQLGRALMMAAASFALALSLTLLFQFWQPEDVITAYWISMIVYGMIAFATGGMTWLLWRVNYQDEIALEEKHMTEQPRPFLTNRMYDALKFVAQILLPALGSFYFALAGIWGLPFAEEVVGTIVIVDALLGTLLGLSTKVYNQSDHKFDGDMVVGVDEDGMKTATMALNDNAGNLLEKKEVLFRVKTDDFVEPPS